MKQFDAFVIGGGSAGVRAARLLGRGRLRVGLAENSKLGGTCVNLGCVPKKLFVYAAEFARHFKDAEGFGWERAAPAFKWQTLIAAKNQEIGRLNRVYEDVLKNNGVAVFKQRAEFIGGNKLRVGKEDITADKIIIATGGRAKRPSIKGREHVSLSDRMFHLRTLPKSIVVVGGGYIALEFASIFHGLGVEVHLAHRGRLPLRGFDRELRKAAAERLARSGINLLLQTEITELSAANNGLITAECRDKDGKNFRLKAGLCLYAIGRIPNIEGLGLEKAGVAVKNGAIKADKNFATSNPKVFAVGDVIDKLQLTPVAIAQAHRLAESLLGKTPRMPNWQNAPTAVFMQPPLASVGLSEEEAVAQGLAVKSHCASFQPMRNLLGGRDEKAVVKVVADEKNEAVLGIHMLGDHSPEIIQGFAAAMTCGLKVEELKQTIALHPTSAEELVGGF